MESDPSFKWSLTLIEEMIGARRKRTGAVRKFAPRRVWQLPALSASAEALVLEDFDRLGVRLAVHDHLGRVNPGHDCVTRSASSTATATADRAAGAAGVGWTALSAEATPTTTAAAAATTEHWCDARPLHFLNAGRL